MLFLSSIENHLLKVTEIALQNTNVEMAPKNVNVFQFRKWNLFLRFLSEIRTLPIDPVFSSWAHVIKKAPVINCSRNSESLKRIYFFFEIRKFFKKFSGFLMFTCAHYSFPIFDWLCLKMPFFNYYFFALNDFGSCYIG